MSRACSTRFQLSRLFFCCFLSLIGKSGEGKGLRAVWSANNRLAAQRIFWYGQKLALVTALNQHSLLCAR